MFKKQKDHWGIFEAVKEIYSSARMEKQLSVYDTRYLADKDFYFNCFFYQNLPDIYKDSKEAVIRHRKEIEKLATDYEETTFWIRKGKQLKCAVMNQDLAVQLATLDLPEYPEIEAEKTKWQNTPEYRYPERTQALEEEMIQLRFVKKGGE